VIVTVDQKLNNGTSVGSIGIWESGSDFMSYTVPKAFYFPLSSSQTLRGEQNILSGQKYNKWMMNTSVDPDVTNHQSFNITQNFVTNLISQLQLTTEGSTIKVDLLDAPGNYSGAVQFKDPWLIDSTDAAHNSKPLNRGMNALYKNRTAPFSPDTATPFGSDVYKGVFLNQYYTIPNNPYYSVSAPQTQTYLNGFTGYFQGWNTTNATLQQVGTNPSGYDQKAVVFNSANATVTAKYKAHLGSSFSTVTTNNSQRRMAVGGGTHIVYESAKAIWYTCYNGSTWSPEILVSNPGYVAKNPSITTLTDQTNWYVDVVWEELDPVDTNAHSVYYRRETITTSSQSWGSFKYLGYSTYKMDASPVVEAFASYPPAVVVWKYGSPGQAGLKMQAEPSVNNTVYEINGAYPANVLQVAMTPAWIPRAGYKYAGFDLAYMKGSIIYHKGFTLNSYSLDYEEIPMMMAYGGGPANPSIISQNQSGGDMTEVVAWDALDVPTQKVFYQVRNSSGSWQTLSYINNNGHQSTKPSLSLDNTSGKINLLFQSDTHIGRSVRDISGGSWSTVIDLGTGTGPNAAAMSPNAVWATGSAAPYSINPTTLSVLSGSGT
jgi:hypothetical protein